jgi:hypothetical protein
MADLLDRLTQRPVRTESLTFALDPNDGVRHSEARNALVTAKRIVTQLGDDPETTPATTSLAAARLAEAQAAFDALGEMVTFTVEMVGLTPSRVQELILEHPPTQQQIKKARALNGGNPKGDPHVNEETYPAALLAETISRITISDDPDSVLTGLTPDQVALFLARCSQDDIVELATTAESLAQAASKVEDLGKS